MPWIVVGLPLAGMCLRTMLGQMVEVGDEEYVRAARAKGLSERAIRRRHIAPAALAPTAMLAGSAMPVLITNVVLVEQVFSIDGVFRDLTRSIGTANVPLILGMTAVGALLIAVTTPSSTSCCFGWTLASAPARRGVVGCGAMNVDWVIPCRYVEVHDNLGSMIGAGIDTFWVPELPARAPSAVRRAADRDG